jgi:CLIP-associating protein 1/2
LYNLRDKTGDQEAQKEALRDLIEFNREASSTEWEIQFKEVLEILIEKISDEESGGIRACALRVLCDLMMRQTKFFDEHIESTIMKILEASKDNEKEVQRASELCAGTAAAVLPAEQSVHVLNNVISTAENPINQAGIKMLTKLVEQQPKNVVLNLLPETMPALVKAYDNPESAVRKAAVFAMVAIYNVVGDDMKIYLNALNGSKMKLLNLYIERSKAQSSGCSSPTSVSAC